MFERLEVRVTLKRRSLRPLLDLNRVEMPPTVRSGHSLVDYWGLLLRKAQSGLGVTPCCRYGLRYENNGRVSFLPV